MKNRPIRQNVGNMLCTRIEYRKACAFLALACTLIVASLPSLLPQHPTAHAASPALQVAPSSSPYPRQIKVIGTGYETEEKVNIYWNYAGPGTGTLERTATTTTTGTFVVLFYVPLAPTGYYSIAGEGLTTGLIATTRFQLLPSLTTTPVAGIASTSLTLTGNAFGAAETVNIYWNYNTKSHNGTLLTTTTSNSTGSFTLTVNAPAGTSAKRITIAAIGQSSQTIALTNFTIYPPTLALAPIQGSPDTTLTLSAYGFASDEQVDFYWDHGTTSIGTTLTDGTGYLSPTTISVPSGSTPGEYAITATGQKSKISSTSMFTIVAPSSQLQSNSGPVGMSVNVTGQGYTPGELVNVLWNFSGPGTGTTIAQITAGISGTITGNFTVPSTSTGSYTVVLTGSTSKNVSWNTFSVSNGIVASPSSAPPGTSVNINGTGYQPDEQVALYWENTTSQPLTTVTADASGNISQAVTFPANALSGTHNMIGVGLTSQITFNEPVTVNTNWGAFGFDAVHDRSNTFENSLGPTTVANLKLRWSANVSGSLWSSPVYANGIVYQASSRGVLNAYSATTGTLIWQYNTQTFDTEVSAPLVDLTTNTVFYGTITQLISSSTDIGLPSPVYGLDATTGALKWSIIIPADEYGFPTLAFDTIYVGAAQELGPGYVLALDVISGIVKWKYFTHSVWGSVAVDTGKDMVFTGNANPNAQVLALNAQSGQLIWQFNVPNSSGDTDVGSGIVIGSNGLVYANSKNGNTYGIYESDGTLAWSTTIALHYDFSDVSSPALSTNGTLYVGSTDTNLYAINASTGMVIWKTAVNNGIASSPALANGVVYFASEDNSFYALDATNGSILWHFTTGNLSYSSPIVVNGWLYCTSSDGKLYAFSL